MLYKKNVSSVERIVRSVAGAGLAIAGFVYFGAGPEAYALAATGAVAIATGVVGFCPACALAGRRLSEE